MELASVGCVRAFGKHFPKDYIHFEKKSIADLDEIRVHVQAMDNQVRMTREASDREQGGHFIPHHRANPTTDEVFAVIVNEKTKPCGHCGDTRHTGQECLCKHRCLEEVLARIRAQNAGGSHWRIRSTNPGRECGLTAHRANVAASTGEMRMRGGMDRGCRKRIRKRREKREQ